MLLISGSVRPRRKPKRSMKPATYYLIPKSVVYMTRSSLPIEDRRVLIPQHPLHSPQVRIPRVPPRGNRIPRQRPKAIQAQVIITPHSMPAPSATAGPTDLNTTFEFGLTSCPTSSRSSDSGRPQVFLCLQLHFVWICIRPRVSADRLHWEKQTSSLMLATALFCGAAYLLSTQTPPATRENRCSRPREPSSCHHRHHCMYGSRGRNSRQPVQE